jgi:hypothetical protein
MRGLIVVLGLLPSLLLAGCTGSADPLAAPGGPGAPALDGPTGVLEGMVVTDNFVGIADAKVDLVGTGHESKTGWNGAFSFPSMPPGKYRIRVDGVGWVPAEVSSDVKAGATTKLTIFVEPLLLPSPYSTVFSHSGTLNCIAVRVMTTTTEDMTCTADRTPNIGLQPDWAATVTEVQWGSNGLSSTPNGRVSLLSKATPEGAAQAYARKVGTSPNKIVLRPATLHTQYGGDVATPEAGKAAPLVIESSKSPVQLGSVDVHMGLTVQQQFHVWHTSFFLQAPSDLEDYSALPK